MLTKIVIKCKHHPDITLTRTKASRYRPKINLGSVGYQRQHNMDLFTVGRTSKKFAAGIFYNESRNGCVE